MQRLPLLLSLLITGASLFLPRQAGAQAPVRFSYQAVVRDANDEVLADTPVGMRISILQGSISGTAVYVETHAPSTNANGLVSVQVGGGAVQSGSLNTIDWGAGPYFIKSETDPNGGSNYTISGTQGMLSVPYALFAASSGGTGGMLDASYDFGGAGAGRTITADGGAVTVAGTDGLLVTGTHGQGATITASGAGSRLFFNPRKSAFRAGQVTDAAWDDANVGLHSFASGFGCTASGNRSVVFGYTSTSTGSESFAAGTGVHATGNRAVAFGSNTVASGTASFAAGISPDATGESSIALGQSTQASGAYSVALGNNVFARSWGEVALGTYGEDYTPADVDDWSVNDRLFTIGNGLGPDIRTNALVLLKNGNLGLGTNTPTAHLHVQNGAVLFNGTTGGTPTSGSGRRLMWIPEKAAFRAGIVNGAQWDEGNMGHYSFAGGQNCTASANYSFAFGSNCMASAQNAVAIGQNCSATGLNAVSLGATGNATGTCSVTLGLGGDATGHGSITAGRSGIASGSGSAAIGDEVIARSFGEVALGVYSADYTPTNATAWAATDRLLVVGNGSAPSDRSNALVMLKNGNTGFGIDAPAAKIHVNDGGVRFTRSLTGTAWELNYDGTDNYFYLDQFGTARHLVVKAGGNMGLGTTDPKSKLHVSSGDVYIDNSARGVIMKSPSGQCWRMTVNNAGTPVFTNITCP